MSIVLHRPRAGGWLSAVLGSRRADNRERAIERRRRTIELAEEPPRLRGALPGVDHARGPPNPAWNAQGVPPSAVAEGLLDQLRDVLQSARVNIGPRAGVVRVGDAGAFADEDLEVRGRRPGRLRFERSCLLEQRQGAVDISGFGAHPTEIQQQQGAPGRLGRVLHALAEGFFPRGRVAGPSRQDLEGKPGARLLRRRCSLDLGRRASALLGLTWVGRDVREVRRSHQQGADFFVVSGGPRNEGIHEAPQVAQATTLLEEPDEPLQRLVERRVCAVGGKVVARRRRLLPDALLRVAHLRQQPSLPCRIGRRKKFGAEAPHRLGESGLNLRR